MKPRCGWRMGRPGTRKGMTSRRTAGALTPRILTPTAVLPCGKASLVDWVWIPRLLEGETLGKLLNLSGPQITHLLNGGHRNKSSISRGPTRIKEAKMGKLLRAVPGSQYAIHRRRDGGCFCIIPVVIQEKPNDIFMTYWDHKISTQKGL